MKQKDLTKGAIGFVSIIIGLLGFDKYRKKRHERKKKQIAGAVSCKRITDNDELKIEFSLVGIDEVDLSICKEYTINEEEKKDWKTLFSSVGGVFLETGLTIQSFNGLLKCDVPLKDLDRVMGNPSSMRGYVRVNGKISKQATFSVVGISNIAPLLIFQCMAAVTSHYYQHVITERLNLINDKLDIVRMLMEESDWGKITTAYSRFQELNAKGVYDISDKTSIQSVFDSVDEIRTKYRGVLNKINFDTIIAEPAWTNKKEVNKMINTLENKGYFKYFKMAIIAESLIYIGSIVSIKIAKYLGKEEDIKIYAGRFVSHYYDYYNKLKEFRTGVFRYLEEEENMFNGEYIKQKKNKLNEAFKDAEAYLLEYKKIVECRTTQYIQFNEYGVAVKKYLPMED